MRTIRWLILISLFLLPTLAYSSSLGSARMSLIQGEVQIRTEDTGEWVPASINMPLLEGDRIWVPEGSRTEIQLRDGTFLRLDENSALEILTVESDSFQFYLTGGRTYINFKGLKGSFLQIDTPISSVRAYERSLYGVDVTRERDTEISVYQGSVNAETGEGSTWVGAGKKLFLREGYDAELAPLGPPDEWERWNRQRDRSLVVQRPPSRYLPEELYPYGNDFEGNGSWVYASGYGYVWRPTVVVSAGWAPYRVGRWVWIRGDYVWISYEPWGWVPYHYGRWIFVTSLGWCWVPPTRGAVYWGPGFVGWVYTPTYVSWVPLAPGEIYYGYGYYGPHSVNITNINITNIQIQKVVYKNIHVQNAVTVIHRDTFLTGKKADIKIRDNPFLKEKISIGRPDIKPEKATRMPVVKEIPQAKRPPEPIREIRVKELKEKRPLVKEKEASVLKSGAPSREMQYKTREGKPVERDFEKVEGRKPTERELGKPKETKPPERRIEKPEPIEKRDQKIKEIKPLEKTIPERPKEIKPSERGVDKPEAIEKRDSKAKEMKPLEKAVPERPKEIKPPGKEGIERQREIKPPEKVTPERSKEIKPPSKEGIERQREFKPQERTIPERPKEVKPSGKESIERQRETKPAERQERLQDTRPQEKEMDKPSPVDRGKGEPK
ncbi:MAG: FecR domain-containing protein [Syntrophaceae bacterium]|nr:FecR domain-containing protein [Syntrophaceae bacterium]